MIRIKSGGPLSHSVTATLADGTPISGITQIDIRIAPNDIVRAEVEIMVEAVDVEAHPLLTLETLRQAAAAHGYNLVKG